MEKITQTSNEELRLKSRSSGLWHHMMWW